MSPHGVKKNIILNYLHAGDKYDLKEKYYLLIKITVVNPIF